MTEPVDELPAAPASPRPLCERHPVVSGVLLLVFFFASVLVGGVATPLILPGASKAHAFSFFMLPLGWVLGWQGLRHLLAACLVALAPCLIPLLVVWFAYRWFRRKPPLGEPVPRGFRPDGTLFLIVPACAATAALAGAIGAWEADLPYGRSVGLMAAVGAAWGLLLAVLQYRGVLPDDEGSPLDVPATPGV